MIDINFLEPKFTSFRALIANQHKPKAQRHSAKGAINLIVVFGLCFAALFIFLNFNAVYSSVNWPWQSERNQELENERLTAELRSVYGYKSGQETTNSNPVSQAQTQNNQASGNQVGSQNYIYIPRLNIKAPIILGVSDSAKDILNDLKKGVELYKGSALPGQGGTTVIIGHSSSNFPWTKYSAIFAGLSKLQTGDTINVFYGGKEYVYYVNFKRTGSVADLASSNISGDLVLGSCWPVGTDEKRIVVVANLVK